MGATGLSDTMTARERFHAVMAFQPFDRLPVVEWATWWNETLAAWRCQGLPPDLNDRYDVDRHFGLDPWYQDWVWTSGPGCPSPAEQRAGLIADESDYDRVRPHLYPDPAVDTSLWDRRTRLQDSGDAVLWLTLEGFFWFARRLLGIENHMFAFYDQPNLLHRIAEDQSEWMLKVLEVVSDHGRPDFMTFAEDMSYNNGPMLSQDLFAEFLAPYYRRVVPALQKMGTYRFVDSDGDITLAVPWFGAVGIQGILPAERQAGTDLGAIQREYPDMRWIGHLDKMAMGKGTEVLEREFERLRPIAEHGGFVPSCDHQTPPHVGYREYRAYLAAMRSFAFEVGRSSQRRRLSD